MRPDTFMVLAALAAGEADAATILQRLREAAGPQAVPTVPTLYRRLADAEDDGWIEVTRGEAESGRGRPAQVYRLTAAGRRVARAEAKRWGAITALIPEARRP